MRYLVLLCLFFFAGCAERPSLHDTDGREVQLKNKWVIVNYWADWCESCVEEIPELNRFYQHHQNKDVLIYGVNFDQLKGNDLQDARRKMRIQFPVVVEDQSMNGIGALPVTYIIDPHGKIMKKIVGQNTEQSLQDTLHTLQHG